MQPNLYPNFVPLLSRAEREQRLGQRGLALWFTGLSGSGKSSIAAALERKLFAAGVLAQVLDGDNIRAGINSNLGFSLADREENNRRLAEIAKLYVHSGLVAITAFISPTHDIRAHARHIIGPDDYFEVFIDTPLPVCEQRDVKGLYAKARRGEIKGFTGIDSPYEPPLAPQLVVKAAELSIEAAAQAIFTAILPLVRPHTLHQTALCPSPTT